jgi:anti-anti-sigma factor
MSLMNFSASKLGRTLRLRLSVSRFVDSGEFDLFMEKLIAEIERHDAPLVILDLAEVEYFASAMLGLLVNTRQRVRALGGKLVIASAPKRLLDTILTTSMDRLFNFARNVDEARQLLESS